ncbi:TrlF family AAA-like ATPase [Clostridium paraputrificum]|uniref:TrlF family AAA-like ATPase n=1 Tax=Clostridium paraputrificum TaxID=29363 RepID=UPI002330F901|nr:hypothetical protein [Clostridium paraputrificum]MDB2105599.1 hypothetical protein [Clostridium paraputrificum]MDB2112160.1 hypothetical protein [Clostridium paraputrificum]
MEYTRGSVWSKWDLHIHTPKSICNEYGGDTDEIWDDFIYHLENLPEEVKVIGINDYYFIDGFEKVMEYKFKKNRLQNIEKIFPILEFRIDTFGTANESNFKKINFHILFNIDDEKFEDEIKKIKNEFISMIHLSKLPQHQSKILTIENLASEGGTLQLGFNNIIPSTEEVFNVLEFPVWKNKVFTFLGYVEWNNLEKGSQLRLFKENLYNNCNAFFTASPDDNLTKKQQVLERFGEKVILHSSDIHKLSELKKENYKCFTWIKGDKTFDGLRQILIEPKERVKIQETNPLYDDGKTNVIDFIKINNGSQWFEDKKLELNSGLVSIIGEKGSGKTALLDLIAISNEEGIYEKDKKNPYSFYNRAKGLIQDVGVSVKYLGGDEYQKVLRDINVKDESDKNAKVRYLSLKELESYCDEKYKFQDFIKDIILDIYPEVEFFDKESKRIVESIKNLNGNICQLKDEVNKGKEIERAIENKKSELSNHLKNEPKISTNFTKEQEEKFTQLINEELGVKSEIKIVEGEISELKTFINWIKIEMESILQGFINKKNINCNSYTYLDKDLIDKIKVEINIINKDELIERGRFLLRKQKELNDTLEKIRLEVTPLELINKNFAEQQDITKRWYEIKNNLEDDIKILDAKNKNIKNKLLEIEKQLGQLNNLYIKLVINKIKQKNKYNELKERLEADSNIEFDIRIEINKDRLFEVEDNIVRHNQGNSKEKISNILNEKLISELNKIDTKVEDDNFEDLIDIIKWMSSDNFITDVFGEQRTIDYLLKKGINKQSFYDWMFDDYFEVNYFIKFKDRPLESLSPGQKGLVLMKIFLKLDKSNKPLLIDQPEDNLDNRSVFLDLVNDIKEIKKKRQVIIATHNPNLVVNTDSEQVIIAKFEDNPSEGECKIKYYAGALEDKYIRDEVCSILEGGDIAFAKRERRYLLSSKQL